MREYRLKTVIPTESDAKGVYYDGDLYFASSNHLFKVKDGKYKRISGSNETILGFSISKRLFTITKDRMYMFNQDKIIGSLKKSFSCIEANEQFIAAGCSRVLEIWHVPKEAKFTLFNLHSRHFGHFLDITCVRFLDNSLVLTASKDCTVRLVNILKNKSVRVCNTIGIPIDIHVIDDSKKEIAVVCEGGVILYYVLDGYKMQFKDRIYINSKILASSSYSGFVAVSLDSNKEGNLLVYKGVDLIHHATVLHKISSISLFGSCIAVRGPKFVAIYDLVINAFLFELDLPKIVSMDTKKNIIATGCSDKKIRLYDEQRCTNTLEDPSMTHGIFSVHILNSSVLSVCIDGRVSVWDIKNGTCYRSFQVEMRVCSTEVSEDGLLLFVANFDDYSIRVVDLQRSKEIDVLKGHEGPITQMVWNRSSLYSASYDNVVKKWDVYNQIVTDLDVGKTITGLCVRDGKMCVSAIGEITIYDEHFDYERSVKISLKARKRNEIFISEKPVECVEFSLDNRFVICGGESNTMKIVAVDTGDVVQEMRVSQNREWENYKDVLGKEADTSFDKTKIIEVLKIIHSESQRMFYVLTRDGISMYEVSSVKFIPIRMDISLTPESIRLYIENEEYLKAMIGSLRLNQYEIIQEVVLSCPIERIEGVVKHLEESLAEVLRGVVSKMIENSMHCLVAVKWLGFIVLYFGSNNIKRPELDKLRRNAGMILKTGQLNRAMLDNIARK
ncbi:hypothetical protein CWI42_012400 [Ordospora colligata]|uniref:Uncharacterized protein n=1 Tax=Ordospora colligata OC4 TaxID=1354746 RepID=A0A0B2UMQ5_9MICR|nr:uncharacterized protein M896_012400 [Ordospora colligata OC4]KHN70584.1 hypothetical protein M896_012400 [Ordospora colligata OC4]TBU17334.1 hypothetical protein CWI41_012400 [Ordospora colligata]TBU17584.1 hypothetical protein CWI40_012400 [Ordospora colligata]TBU19764.1 hypothetical protein CWI42_012400 [Ordospora colligata]